MITRSLARLYVTDIDVAVADLRRFLDAPVGLRFRYGALELASIGGFLLIAGSPEALAPFRATQATAITDDLDAVLATSRAAGDVVVSEPRDVPSGRNATIRHRSGAVIEYVQFDPAKLRSLGPAEAGKQSGG